MLGLWLVHRPPTATLQMLALRLLHALAGSPAAAWAAAAQGGAVYLLSVLLPTASAAVASEVRAHAGEQVVKYNLGGMTTCGGVEDVFIV